MTAVRLQARPVPGASHPQQHAQPATPSTRQPVLRARPDVGAAKGCVKVAAEEVLRSFHVARPAAQELHVLPVGRLLERLQVMAAQLVAREMSALGADVDRVAAGLGRVLAAAR